MEVASRAGRTVEETVRVADLDSVHSQFLRLEFPVGLNDLPAYLGLQGSRRWKLADDRRAQSRHGERCSLCRPPSLDGAVEILFLFK
jgi:hypothetical protein